MDRYFYDDSGFRAAKSALVEGFEGAEKVNLLHASKYFTIEERKDSYGNAIPGSYSAVNHIYLNGVRIAAATPAGGAMYFLTDQVESVKVVVNDQGLPVSRTEYLPYGETWFQEGESGHTPKYNSQEMDKESGFYFFNARHYDSEIGRFVTADSIVDGVFDTQGWNRYMYVRGNPIRYMDPTGNLLFDNTFQLKPAQEPANNVSGNEGGISAPSQGTNDAAPAPSGGGGEQAAVSQTKEQVEGALQQAPEGNYSLSDNLPYNGNNILDIFPPGDVQDVASNGKRILPLGLEYGSVWGGCQRRFYFAAFHRFEFAGFCIRYYSKLTAPTFRRSFIR
jgi:RHS repeat-associated protein